MGNYDEAISALQKALLIRRQDLRNYGYSSFQLFICKDYAGFPISPLELEAIKRTLWEWADITVHPWDLGDIFQNLAYIEQRTGDVRKAIWLYQVAEVFRGIAEDQRGLALTWARLGECYIEFGDEEKAKEYGERALRYFEEKDEWERIRQVKQNIFAKIQENKGGAG